MRAPALLALLVVAACGGGPPRSPGTTPSVPGDVPSAGEAPLETRYLDEDCVLSADHVFLVLPRVLRGELATEALAGGWEGEVYRGRGRVDVRVRRLRIVADSIEIRLTGGPVANLRARAEGNARVSATTVAHVDEPARTILLKPDALLIE